MFRVGVIGLGFIGDTHIQAFNQIPNVEVSAVCDLSQDQIDACIKKHPVLRATRDYHELLALHDLDLVVVCLPNNLHAPVTIQALHAGHNVLCEKPMANTVHDAKAMIEAAKANQRVLSIALNFRWQYFGPDAFHLKQLLEDNQLGRIYYVRVHYLRRMTFPLAGYERWNLDVEKSGGGVLMDLGPHMLDLAMWLLGDYTPVSVYGTTHNGLTQYSTVDDFASGALALAGGARIQVDLAWSSHNQTSWQINIYGEKGGAVIEADKPDGQRLTRFTVADNQPAIEPVNPAEIDKPPESSVQEHVVSRLIAGETPDCSAEKALEVLRVIEGWYGSSETGRVVTL